LKEKDKKLAVLQEEKDALTKKLLEETNKFKNSIEDQKSEYEKKIKELNDQIVDLGKNSSSNEDKLRLKYLESANQMKKEHEQIIRE